MKTMTTTMLALALMLATGTTHATLIQCRPSPNCGSADRPCNTYIDEGDTRTLDTRVLPGASVIRVRVCTKEDAVCKDGTNTQTVSVFGYAGSQVVYTRHLNVNDGYDTGGYTKLPSLTRLAARCSGASPGGHCLVAWQHCKEPLPLRAPGG
jgi:hypothetical protein